MLADSRFYQGAKAAIPIWIAFVPFSFALGVAAKTHGLSLGEIVLMSALVYAGPAQFAVLEPLGSGKPALQILVTTFLINLRFLPMSTAIAPYFRRVKRTTLLLCSHLISASSFILPYARFQREAQVPGPDEPARSSGRGNLHYFLGVAATSFSVWVLGSGIGYWAALQVPPAFDEGLKFVLPGYFACMLTAEIRERTSLAVSAASFLAAVPGAMLNPEWGWLATATLAATLGWEIERWIGRA